MSGRRSSQPTENNLTLLDERVSSFGGERYTISAMLRLVSRMVRLVLAFATLVAAAQAQMGFPATSASALADAETPLTISTSELPRGVAQFLYYSLLQAEGGTPPYRWTFDGGNMPAGLEVDRQGFVSGTPVSTGDFLIRVRVSDSAPVAQTQVREFVLHIFPPLIANWIAAPSVQGNAIRGSVKVTNFSPDALDTTLIIVAVDGAGKAWALGYQHLTLTAGRELSDVPFGSMLPVGQYIIRMDAIGEDNFNGRIFRSALQTPQPLAVVASP